MNLRDDFQRIFLAFSVLIPKVDPNFLPELQTNLLLEDDPELLDERSQVRYLLEFDPTQRSIFHIRTLKRTNKLMVPMFYRSVNICSHVVELAYKQLIHERYSLDTDLEYYSFPSMLQIINLFRFVRSGAPSAPIINCILGPKYLTVYTFLPKTIKDAADVETMADYLNSNENNFIQEILDNNDDFDYIQQLYKYKMGVMMEIYLIGNH